LHPIPPGRIASVFGFIIAYLQGIARIKTPPNGGGKPPPQLVKKVFLTSWASFLNFEKVQKTLFIERAGGFLPPAHRR